MRSVWAGFLDDAIGAGFLVPDFAWMQAAAILLGIYLVLKRAERTGLDTAATWRASLAAVAVALVSARLFFVAQELGDYRQHPGEVLQIWRGGMASSGAFLGGLLAVVAAGRRQALPLARFLDCAAPSIALSIALQRIGCFLDGCCYGVVTSLPWGVRFPPGSPAHTAHLQAGLIDPEQPALPVHPTQLYEAALALLVLGVLLAGERLSFRGGGLFALLFVLYPAGRLLNEIVRADDRGTIGIFSVPQVLCLVALTSALAFLGRRLIGGCVRAAALSVSSRRLRLGSRI